MNVTKNPSEKVGWLVEKNKDIKDDRPGASVAGVSEVVNSDCDGSNSVDNAFVMVEVPNSPRNIQRLPDPASLVLLQDTRQPGNENHVASDYIITVAKASKDIRLGFLARVFGLLATQMLVTFGLTIIFSSTEWITEFVQNQTWIIWPGVVGSLILYIMLFFTGKKTPNNLILLTTFMLCLAVTIALIASSSSEFVGMMATFALLTAFGCLWIYTVDKIYEYVVWYALLIGCLSISLVGSFSEMIPHPTIPLGYIAGIYSVMSLFCVHMIVDICVIMEQLSPEEYIFATITLYTDIICSPWKKITNC